ncbi:MAG: GspH/FimT family pseudopilin [Zoogloeaceae bacterium]|jgi:type IV fimbrial biogenesis protein FimT|nr:GspH/FimT family pseudopilin [Zoogloeaceae bacterium]
MFQSISVTGRHGQVFLPRAALSQESASRQSLVKPFPRRKGAAGFTLIELMMTVFIAMILMAIASANWRPFIEKNRARSATNDLVTTLAAARSEAILRGKSVSVCANASDASLWNSSFFEYGWRIVEARDCASASSALPSIKEYAKVVHLNLGTDPSSSNWEFSFGRDGKLTSGTKTLCIRGTNAAANRKIEVNMLGRVKVTANPPPPVCS